MDLGREEQEKLILTRLGKQLKQLFKELKQFCRFKIVSRRSRQSSEVLIQNLLTIVPDCRTPIHGFKLQEDQVFTKLPSSKNSLTVEPITKE